MSRLWTDDIAGTATRVPPWVRPEEVSAFRPWSMGDAGGDALMSMADHDPSPVHSPADLQAKAFAEGYEEGCRSLEDAFAEERAALVRLMESVEALKPEPATGLAMLLAETVERLVRQVMGEVTIDRDTLAERAEKVAEMISEEAGAKRLRLHPDDLALLGDSVAGVAATADHSLVRGTIRLEMDEGWIEDGPEARLERLRAALDKMGLGA